jgi:hypothetical protein
MVMESWSPEMAVTEATAASTVLVKPEPIRTALRSRETVTVEGVPSRSLPKKGTPRCEFLNLTFLELRPVPPALIAGILN